MDSIAQKKIGPLEELDASGGGSGHTLENVTANWSPDGRWLAATYRIGRLMHNFELYEIKGKRAIPTRLEWDNKNPKGKVLDHLTMSSNPGHEFSKWTSSTCFSMESYGLREKKDDPGFDYDKYGLGDFDGTLEFIYHD
jgi:hypothetical protein